MIVNDIVRKARRRLGDTKSTGWDDDTLISLVDQGQKDLCITANLYKRTLFLGLSNLTKLYPLPCDCFQIDRVEYTGEPLSILSREDQDTRYSEKGFHIIKNDINMSTIELSEVLEDLDNYPSFVTNLLLDEELPEIVAVDAVGVIVGEGSDTIYISPELGVLIGVVLESEASETLYGDVSSIYTTTARLWIEETDALGVVTSIDFNYNVSDGLHGFLTNVGLSQAAGTYGVCTDVLDNESYLKIYYSAYSSTVNSLYDALVISQLWEKALVHYVVGMARQDDIDESNYALGEREVALYEKESKKASKLASRSYSSSLQEAKQTQYRRT